MEVQTYNEEFLRGKKYGELFKIGKSIGVKSSKKLKTDKLIEAILECQDSNTLSVDAGAVIAALAGDQVKGLEKNGCVEPQQQKEGEQREELLSDIQFPELFPSEEDEPEKAVGNSSENGCWRKNEGNNDDANEKQLKKRRRTGTFEIEKKTESLTEEMALSEPKRQRTSTYEVLNETGKPNPSNEVSPIGGSQQKIEDNSKQLNLLVQKVSNKRRTRTIAVDSPAADLSSTVPNGTRRALPSTKEHLAHRNSRSAFKPNHLCDKGLARVAPTAEPPSEIADKSKPKVSKAQSTTHQKSLDVTATPSSQKSQAGVRLSVNTPKSIMKATNSAKIVKPIFTVGRNDASPAKKEGFKHDGSGIPRFVSYARRLKVPNFARIHERAFNRMEALDDYVDKKRKRTDTFGSATKKSGKVAPEEVFQPTVTSTRNLNFNFISTRSPSNKTPSFSKSKAIQLEGSKSRKSLTSLASAQKLTKKSPKVAETPQSTVKETSKSSNKFCNTLKKTPKTVKKFTGHPSAVPRLLKENVKPVNLSLINPAPSKRDASQKQEISDSVPKRLEYDPKTDSNITTSYVPHKGAVKPLTNRSTLKNMAQRKPKIKSRQEIREGQQKILKGVRFNRRFELQMANRGITL